MKIRKMFVKRFSFAVFTSKAKTVGESRRNDVTRWPEIIENDRKRSITNDFMQYESFAFLWINRLLNPKINNILTLSVNPYRLPGAFAHVFFFLNGSV